MDRERQRKEKERRDRENEMRSREGGKEIQLVDQHFAESFRRFEREKPQHNIHLSSDSHPTSAYYGHPSQHQTSSTNTVTLSQHQQSNSIFQALAAQKGTHWSQSGLPGKLDGRDHRPQSLAQVQHADVLRKVKEPEQLVRDRDSIVRESISKAFSDVHPPPAHTKLEKNISSSLPSYQSSYQMKELKHPQDRNAYAMLQEKPSVIVKPELQYEKIPPHSVSPKQRIGERSSPYSTNSSSGPNPYKPYEPSPSPHSRGSAPHHQISLPSSPISVELTKPRPPHSSPLSAAPHIERYYSSGTKTPVTHPYHASIGPGTLSQSHHHSNSLPPSKSKVSSPPGQMYGKPGITSGTPVCKIDTRPSQSIPLSKPSGPPPPAHSGSRNPENRLPPTSHNRSQFDQRMYTSSGVCPPKPIATNLPPHTIARGTPPMTSHVSIPSNHPTQTQPLDLGTRDDSSSPNRRRSQTPTPQEAKKPRLDHMAGPQPLLSRVSEPSPLYPSAATTITTVENIAAISGFKKVSSPVQNIGISNSQHGISSTASNATTATNGCMSNPINSTSSSIISSNEIPPTIVSTANTKSLIHPPPSTTPTNQREENSSPTASTTMKNEPEKSSSPGPGSGGYVHKLKKAWLQRHESGTETPVSSPTSLPTRVATPPPSQPSVSVANAKTTLNTVTSVIKQDLKNGRKSDKTLPLIPNGHVEDSKDGDSTSSDTDNSSNRSIKGKKAKKRTHMRSKASESNSDSEKESDGSEGSLKKQRVQKDYKTSKKRGRKPKVKIEKDDGSKLKKVKDEIPPTDPLLKPPIPHLKKTGESFLQDRACYEVAPKLPKCRECRWTPHQRNKKMPNIFCRFYAFRRLRYTKNGQLAVAGFSDPVKDAFGEDLRLWVPDPASPAPDLDKEMSTFLLTHVGDQFCDLVQQENEAMSLHIGEETTVAWKRVVQGVREMCDVCETTLFNIHWACSKCGFVVCIDCYKGRKEGTVKVWELEDGAKERDKYSWLLCASRLPHEQDKLMLTQIIAGNALKELGKKIHEIRYKWGIPMYCGCPEANLYKEKEQEDKKLNGLSKDILMNIKKEPKQELVNGSIKQEKDGLNNGKDEDMSNSPLNFFAEVALSNDKRESESSNTDSDSDSDEKGQSSTLRELLVRPNAKSGNSAKEDGNSQTKTKEPSKKKVKHDTLDDVISCVIDRGIDKDNKKDPMKVELKHFIRKYNYNRKGREPLPIRIMTKTESRLLYPNVAHSWLCDGKLLRLHDSSNKESLKVFQDQWKRGQPVIVSGTGQNLSSDLWKPSSFSRDFGDIKNNLINCLTDNIVPNQPMKKFWDGFENYSKRLKDEKGQAMVLKLKDWPPGDDFAEVLPKRFEDLMKVLPMGDYTRRNGSLNLAGRLPECFVRPDLGPKMYIAYGSAVFPNKASTNLHLDISDAVNVMCYVGIPKDVSEDEYRKESLKAIEIAGCDILTRNRVHDKDEVPGALWHIYHARDADKIRDLLNKIAIERGKKLEPFHDPIHDQSWYLDGILRERLYKEYGVEGYAIVQCMGDAVFVPAGAPHQVRNLHNCIKVAEDFVSPENVSHCFHLTQEFRHLSDTHTNHEDKLQIKNIIYHAMKDSIAYLMASEQNSEEIKREKQS